jgi:hypothetical protein
VRANIERLGIDIPGDSSSEPLIKVQRFCSLPSQARHPKIVAAIRPAMVGQDAVRGLVLGRTLRTASDGRWWLWSLGQREQFCVGIDHNGSDCDQESARRFHGMSNSRKKLAFG